MALSGMAVVGAHFVVAYDGGSSPNVPIRVVASWNSIVKKRLARGWVAT